jgi:hypothetical protein
MKSKFQSFLHKLNPRKINVLFLIILLIYFYVYHKNILIESSVDKYNEGLRVLFVILILIIQSIASLQIINKLILSINIYIYFGYVARFLTIVFGFNESKTPFLIMLLGMFLISLLSYLSYFIFSNLKFDRK